MAAELTIGEPPSADVIAFMPNPDADAAVAREAESLVTVRAKPEKRKNAKERAKERAGAKGKLEAVDVATVTAEVTAPETAGLATAHPKPEKRKNAKERAKEKYAKAKTEDGTTPDTTAKAKSKVKAKAETKVETKKAKKSKAAYLAA